MSALLSSLPTAAFAALIPESGPEASHPIADPAGLSMPRQKPTMAVTIHVVRVQAWSMRSLCRPAIACLWMPAHLRS